MVRSVEEPRAEQDASAVASTATVDAAVRTLVSPGFEPEDLVEGPVAKYKRDTGKWCCLLCQRQFATETLLAHHLNGGAHLRKLAHAESSGRIKRGAVATGTHHREGASGGAGSGVKAGCLGSQLVSPSPQQGQQGPGPSLPQGASPSAGQRLRQGHQLGGSPHVTPEARRHRARAEVTREGNGPAELQPLESLEPSEPLESLEPLEALEVLEVLEAMTPRTVRACR